MKPAETQKTEQIWEVEINNCIFSTNLRELKDWIRIGKLNPTHKVRMKKLAWIEAQKVPAFNKMFDDKNQTVKFTTTTTQQSPSLQSPSLQNPPLQSLHHQNQPLSEIPLFFTPSNIPQAVKTESFPIIPLETEDPINKVAPEIKPIEPVFSIPIVDQNQKTEAAVQHSVKSSGKFIEATFFCPTCFYFCRFIPIPVEENAFPCPVCFTDCLFVQSTEQKAINQPKSKQKPRTIFELTDLEKRAKLGKKKSVFGILFSFLLAFLLATGGAYLWVYQLRSPIENDENTNNELVILQEKFTTDKISVSIRFAALEQIPNTANSQDPTAPNSDISQELAKLQKQYDLDRKTLVDNYQDKKAKNDFQQIALISFISLSVLYLLKRLFLS